MSEVERLKFDAVMQERDKARRECDRLKLQLQDCRLDINALQNQLSWARQQLAEALNGEAAAAGPIVDQRIKELERQSEETELERRAWELFSQIPDVTIEQSFYKASQWIYHRDQQRKAGAT